MTTETKETTTETPPSTEGDKTETTANPPETEKNTEKSGKNEKTEKNLDSGQDYSLSLEKDSLLDQDDLKAVSEFAKEGKLDEKSAKSLLTLKEDAVGKHLDKLQDAHKEKVGEWSKEVEARKEYKAETEAVDLALEKFGGDDLAKSLKESGYRHWQPLWDFMSKVGEAMKDDSFVHGKPSQSDPKPKTIGQKMYGDSMNKK